MGGSIDVVTSALDLLSEVAPANEQRASASKESKLLRAEREAQEAELARKETAERKRRRDSLTESRERQRRLQDDETDESTGHTTLLHGGAGLTDDPDVAAPTLKEKFGE